MTNAVEELTSKTTINTDLVERSSHQMEMVQKDTLRIEQDMKTELNLQEFYINKALPVNYFTMVLSILR